jgi:hypothetical protein
VVAARRLLGARRGAGATDAELASLLARLGEAETSPEAKAAAFTELAELRFAAGDAGASERSWIEAVAQAPTPSRLTGLLQVHAGVPAEQARALAAVVARAQELDRPNAECLAALGRLEVEALDRSAAGIGHLRLAVALAPTMYEARASLAAGLVNARATAEAVATLVPMLAPDSGPLLALHDPSRALATLETALAAEGRHDEALVAREVRAIAGGLDDGGHAELRARRLAIDPSAPVPIAMDRATMRSSVVPPEMPTLPLDLAAAISGAEAKLARVDLDDVGVTARERLAPASGHPLLMVAYRLATMLGTARPEMAVSADVHQARVVVREVPWLVVPAGLVEQPEPVQTAIIARLLARIALGVPWLEDFPSGYAHALLCGAARQVVPDYAAGVGDSRQEELVEEFARRVGRAIGRRHKKALSELAPALVAAPALTLEDVAAFEYAVGRTELRVAFVATGDLLATLDAARALDPEFARVTASVGIPALAATLRHPLSGDVARFALARSTIALRWRAGSLWSVPDTSRRADSGARTR